MWLLVLAGCGGASDPGTVAPATPTPPPSAIDTFGAFYEAFQDRACDLAVDECVSAAETLDCTVRLDTPACDGFNSIAAQLCLDGPITCGDESRLECSTACAEVCQNISFQELGFPPVPESCRDMLLCDEALANVTNGEYTQVFPEGLHDPAYGAGGTCYEGDREACASACQSAFDGLSVAAEAYVDAGVSDEVPSECR